MSRDGWRCDGETAATAADSAVTGPGMQHACQSLIVCHACDVRSISQLLS